MASFLLAGTFHSVVPAPASWSYSPGSGREGPRCTSTFTNYALSHFNVRAADNFLLVAFVLPPLNFPLKKKRHEVESSLEASLKMFSRFLVIMLIQYADGVYPLLG